MPVSNEHKCKSSDLVRLPRPAQGPDGESVTFNLKCRHCGRVFQESYVVVKGLWDGLQFVELEP
jgi:hypothetical protein